MPGTYIALSPHLGIFQSHVNVGVLRDGEQALLIDCGDGAVVEALRRDGVTCLDAVLFTHHHRDLAGGAAALATGGTRLIVPADERALFEHAEAAWRAPEYRRHAYDARMRRLILAESLPVSGTMTGGDTLTWGPARITALATPGHTDGSLTYLVEVDGRRVAFCGDLIAGPGQVWELFSLQKGITTTDYHGFLGAREELVASLLRVRDAAPEMLIPAHGVMMDDPSIAIEALITRLQACYDAYAAVSALRWYFPDMFAAYADDPRVMPMRTGKPVPGCLRHLGTTWVLISETGGAFVMDCANAEIVTALRQWLAAGDIRAVEGLWITHYHFDHTDGTPAFRHAFDCPVIADAAVAEVIADPPRWRLPCLSPLPIPVDRRTDDGERWTWHEFTFTAYHLPGQTHHHGGLLAEGRGLRMFFAGDSFTPAGIDDYCAQNRNFLGAGAGFDRCLALLEALQPDHIFNAHVDVAFDFTAEEICTMRANLLRREALFGALCPWEHANFALDESWAYCDPYEQHAAPGDTARVEVVITNHAPAAQPASCRPVLPRGWGDADETSTVIGGHSVSRLPCAITVPSTAAPGCYLVPVDLRFGERCLPQWTEAVVVVSEEEETADLKD